MTASISGFRPPPPPPPPTAASFTSLAKASGTPVKPKGGDFVAQIPSQTAKNPVVSTAGYNANNVNRAFNQIKTSFKNAVTTDELEQSAKNISALRPTERSALVNLMANTPQGSGQLLDKFLGEVVAPGFLNQAGLDAGKQRALFRDLIPAQSGQNIEAMFKAIGKAYGPVFSEAQNAFSATVAKNATAAQKIDTVARLVNDAGTGKSKPAARFIGELAGSLKNPNEIKAALSKLDRPTWDTVVRNSIDVTLTHNMNDITGSPNVTRDPSVFSNLATAVANSGDNKSKASFIAASGLLLKVSADATPAEQGAVTKGMTQVITSDTNGVISGTMALSGYSHKRDKNGKILGQYASDGMKAMGAYNKSLMNSGQGETIKLLMAQLRSGNNLQQDALTRINGIPGAARTLGQYTGTVVSAIDAQTSDKTRAVVVGAVFGGTAIDISKEVVGIYKPLALAMKLLAPGVKALMAMAALQINSEAISDGRDASQLIIKIAKPQGPGGEPLSTAALSEFDSGDSSARAASR